MGVEKGQARDRWGHRPEAETPSSALLSEATFHTCLVVSKRRSMSFVLPGAVPPRRAGAKLASVLNPLK